MTFGQAALFWVSAVSTVGAIYIGRVCDGMFLPFPTPSPHYTVSTPYSVFDLIVLPTATPPEEEPIEPYLPIGPTATPKPAYDSSPIDSDMDGDNCFITNGCAEYLCHYSEFGYDGSFLILEPRARAAHLAQHPNDYVDYLDSLSCIPLENHISHPLWNRNNEVHWDND